MHFKSFTAATLAATLAAPLLAASLSAPAAAQDQPELDARVERQLGVKLPLPDRPIFAGGRLVWKDIALADLCAELGGDFSKLPGKAIYLCRHESFPRSVATANDAGVRE